jgi:UDPglucose--hexose-1-phosphate uridylyltransferase
MILPKKHLTSLSDFSASDEHDLSDILSRITRAYDRVFNVSFPYSMGIHQKPTDGKSHDEWQFHIHFYPPLLRSATVKKFLVGYEMMAEAQRDIIPEDAAKTLRNLI